MEKLSDSSEKRGGGVRGRRQIAALFPLRRRFSPLSFFEHLISEPFKLSPVAQGRKRGGRGGGMTDDFNQGRCCSNSPRKCTAHFLRESRSRGRETKLGVEEEGGECVTADTQETFLKAF